MSFIKLLPVFFLVACATGLKKDITYQVDGVNHIGHIASNVKKGERKPGVIIVHEWWGHNTYARKRADQLAELGYVAMSIDMYGEGKQASHPKDAGAFAKAATKDFSLAKKRFEAALKILKSRDDVDPNKIAAIGYCFGGGIVLNMTRAGVDLDLVASFHGSLKSPMKAKKGKVKVKKVLVYNGAKDPMIKPEHIASFKKEMAKAKINYTFKNYPNALHAFTNKEADMYGKKFKIPLAYDAVADSDSWRNFLQNLESI